MTPARKLHVLMWPPSTREKKSLLWTLMVRENERSIVHGFGVGLNPNAIESDLGKADLRVILVDEEGATVRGVRFCYLIFGFGSLNF